MPGDVPAGGSRQGEGRPAPSPPFFKEAQTDQEKALAGFFPADDPDATAPLPSMAHSQGAGHGRAAGRTAS